MRLFGFLILLDLFLYRCNDLLLKVCRQQEVFAEYDREDCWCDEIVCSQWSAVRSSSRRAIHTIQVPSEGIVKLSSIVLNV